MAVSDNDVPVDFVLAAPATVAEGGGSATVTVTATTAEDAPPATPVEVQLAHVGGTAAVGTDYDAVSETVRFEVSDFEAATVDGQPRYQAVWTHDVVIHDDEVAEGDETVLLEMSPTSAWVPLHTLHGAGDPVRATVTIMDNDLPMVTIAADNDSVVEELGAAGFTLSRTGSTAAELTVTVAVTQQVDRDYLPDGAAAQRTATFAVDSATAALGVALQNDDLAEATAALTVEVQAGSDYTVGDPASATLTVLDADTGRPTPANLTAGAGIGQVALSWDAHAPYLVFRRHQYRYKTDGGYPAAWIDIPDSGQHTTGAGDGSNLTGYTVTGLVGGQSHAFQVRTSFSTDTSDPSDEATATPGSAAVSFGAESYSVDEGGTVAVTMQLDGAPGREVTVPVSAAGAGGATPPGATGADWSGVPENVTFGATSTMQTFTLAATDDADVDPGESVSLSFGTLPAGVTAGTPSEASVTIVDAGAPVVTIAADNDSVVEELGAAGFTLSRTGSTAAELTVKVVVTQQVDRDYLPDGAAAQRTATFAVDSATAALGVALQNDDLAEATAALTVEVQAGSDYTVGDPASATLTVLDADTGRPTPANLTAGAGIGQVALSWDAHAPYLVFRRHQYRYKTAGDYPAAWIDIPDSGQHTTGAGDGSNLTGYTVTGLVGGQSHAFQVRTSFSTDTSDPSDEATATPGSAAVSFGAGSYSVDEGGSVEVTVQLDAAPGREVTVPVSAAGAGGATPPGETGADWSGVPESVTFGATDTEHTFTLAATDDADPDAGESVSLSFGTLPAGVTAGTPSEASVTIVDAGAPVVTIAADKTVVWDYEGTAGFTLSRTRSTAATLTVTVEVTQEVDRDLLPDGAEAERTVMFAVNSATTALSVELENDDLSELAGDLTVEVQAGSGYTVGDPASATVEVRDGDEGNPQPANLMAEAGAGVGEVALSWDAHAPHLTFYRHQYRYKTDGNYAAWTDIPNSGQHTVGDGSNLTGYTVTGLVGGQSHTFQVRTHHLKPDGITLVVSDSSNEATATPRSAAVSFGAESYSVDEGGSVEVTVQLDGAPGREVTVPVLAAGAGGATAPGETGADWSGVPESVTFGATDTAQTFTLAATDDTDVDAGESVALSFGTLPAGVTAGTPSEATVTIVDDDAAMTPTCTLNAGDLWCGVVTVGTSSDGVGFVAADTDVGALTDNNGDQTITIGSDSYTISSLLVRNSPAGALSIDLDKSFPPGDVATLEFDIGTKTFKVSEATAYASGFGYFWTDSGLTWTDGGPDVTLRLRRAAEEEALPELSVANAEASEGDPVEFTVTLSPAAAENVTVNWATSVETGDTATEGTDFTAASGTLSITAGQTTATIAVQTTEDTTDEANETFTVTLSSPTNATLATDPTATGTITDADLPVVTIAADKGTVTEDEGAADFTLSRTGPTTAELTVTVEVTQEVDRDLLPDGAAAERMVTFAVGSAMWTLSVTLKNDDLRDAIGDLTVEVQAGMGYTVGAPASATLTVIDTDRGLPKPANLEASAGAGVGEVALSWDAYAPYLVFVRHQYRYKTDGDYPAEWTDIPNSGQHATGAGDGSNLTGYTVTGLVGGQVHTFQVRTFTSLSSASDPSNEATATPRSAAVSFGAGSYSVDEGSTVAVTVQLDAAPGREVTVPVSAAGAGGATPPGETGADWSGVPESVTFGATDTAQTFTLAATDDADVDAGESVALSFGTLPAGVTAGTQSEATVTIVDNDVANAAPTAADGTVTTDEDTAYAFDASDFGFTDTDTDDELASVRVVTLPGSGTLAVSGAAVSADQEVAASDLGGNLTYTPVADEHGSGYASFTFRVSDGTDESAAAYTMTIDVNAVNDAPTAADGTVTTDEDTAYAFDASDFGFADADTGDGLASVRVVTVPGSGTLAVSGSAVSADQEVAASDLGGSLTYTPAADGHGIGYASFTFRVSDGTDESAAAYTMTIDVNAVNDAPTLASALPDRSATVGEAFSYQVPEDAFSDVDGDTLSYAATRGDDSELPAWLSFDATTRTFSGTAAAGDTGTVTVRVTASDGNGETASTTFVLAVTAAANAAPTAADQTVTTDEDTAYAFGASDFGFTDTDTDGRVGERARGDAAGERDAGGERRRRER